MDQTRNANLFFWDLSTDFCSVWNLLQKNSFSSSAMGASSPASSARGINLPTSSSQTRTNGSSSPPPKTPNPATSTATSLGAPTLSAAKMSCCSARSTWTRTKNPPPGGKRARPRRWLNYTGRPRPIGNTRTRSEAERAGISGVEIWKTAARFCFKRDMHTHPRTPTHTRAPRKAFSTRHDFRSTIRTQPRLGNFFKREEKVLSVLK